MVTAVEVVEIIAIVTAVVKVVVIVTFVWGSRFTKGNYYWSVLRKIYTQWKATQATSSSQQKKIHSHTINNYSHA